MEGLHHAKWNTFLHHPADGTEPYPSLSYSNGRLLPSHLGTALLYLRYTSPNCISSFLSSQGITIKEVPLDSLPTSKCPRCGGDAVPRAYLPDLVISRKRRIVVEISGKKSSIHDRAKVDFYNRAGVCWVEVTNESARSPEAVKAVCQALALSVGTSHPERVWGSEEFP